MSTNMVDHGEDGVPSQEFPLVFEEEGHVQSNSKVEVTSISQVPCVVKEFGPGVHRNLVSVGGLEELS